MTKTAKPEGRAAIVGRATAADLENFGRPISDLMREIDELTAEQETNIRETAKRNGVDPEAIYKRWNSQTRAKRA
jgi:hypothetical protein